MINKTVNKNPLVSVIISTYNRYELTKQALDSVFNQTYKNIEIILIDDGSTDHTQELSNLGNIKYLRQKHTGLPGQVRNIGSKSSNGEYIAFLDSDDIYKEQKIEKQINFFKNNPNILICHTREIWQRNTKIISQSKQKHNRQGDIFKDALVKCIIGPSTVMLKRKLLFEIGIDMFNPVLEIAEDYELWLRICNNYKIGYIDEPLIIKRAGAWDQLSWKYKQIEIFRINALLLNIKNKTFTGTNMQLAKEELIRKCRIYAAGCIKREKNKEAEQYLEIAENYC